jgi:hypothetical protein
MNAEPIRHVPIWSCWHRATHWLIACGVLFELFSGKRYFMSIASKGSRSGCLTQASRLTSRRANR